MALSQARTVLSRYRSLFAPVAMIGVIHIIGGAAVLLAQKAVDVSQLAGIVMLIGRYPILIGVGLIAVGIMAIVARMVDISRGVRTALIVPQQIVLLMQFIGVLIIARTGVFPDGYVPVPGDWYASLWFIASDQAALLVLCLSHTVEFLWLRAIPTFARYEAMIAENVSLAIELREARQALSLREQTAMWEAWTEEMKQEVKSEALMVEMKRSAA
jgi:hypothetical protein